MLSLIPNWRAVLPGLLSLAFLAEGARGQAVRPLPSEETILNTLDFWDPIWHPVCWFSRKWTAPGRANVKGERLMAIVL
jgi:hypothetical protein